MTGPLAHHVVLNHTFELLINTKMLFSFTLEPTYFKVI